MKEFLQITSPYTLLLVPLIVLFLTVSEDQTGMWVVGFIFGAAFWALVSMKTEESSD